LALSPRIISAVAQFKPDIIHASSPGIMVSVQSLYLIVHYPQHCKEQLVVKTHLYQYCGWLNFQVFGALIIAKLLSVPIVMSYHTHVPV